MDRVSLLQSFGSFFSIALPYHQPDPEIEAKVLELENVGIVCAKISPGQTGQIEYRGSWWSAVCLNDLVLLPKTRVKVIDRVNLILVVEPIAIAQARAARPKKRFERDRTA